MSAGADFFSTDSSGSVDTLPIESTNYSSLYSNVDPLSATAVTATSNPPLASSTSSLAATGGAALNTVPANPTVYSSGGAGVVQDISAATGMAAQWGSTIAGALGLGSPSVGITTQGPVGNNNNLMIFGVIAIGIILLVVLMEDK